MFRLLSRLPLEVARVTRDSYRQSLETVWAGLRLGVHLTRGLVRDLYYTRSPFRLINDVRWAAKKVVGPQYTYAGNVVVVFGEQDALIRWKAILPECNQVEELGRYLEGYCKQEFPCVRDLDLQIIGGNHLAPELRATEFIRAALGALHRQGIDL